MHPSLSTQVSSTVVSSTQHFYIYCSIVIKFRFTKLLHVFVEVLVVFLETFTDIILCTNTKIKVFAFLGSILLWDMV